MVMSNRLGYFLMVMNNMGNLFDCWKGHIKPGEKVIKIRGC